MTTCGGRLAILVVVHHSTVFLFVCFVVGCLLFVGAFLFWLVFFYIYLTDGRVGRKILSQGKLLFPLVRENCEFCFSVLLSYRMEGHWYSPVCAC